ncbi:MoxR family ATPase [Hymenobacter tibetensis]|uniref:MoxR family ATPase n=1 Tax=Hymenobacter tibetensis TaxID=497967 RepID=A0ABY4CU78_9BACT|nr:MoxR family ATPase [Hymenobacter tibetensis]UOG73833.1 MoxR family ATPase [Hymenobacter tibetensis]
MDNTLDATENTPTPNPPTPLASVSVPETSTPDLASTSSGPEPEEAASPDPTASSATTAFAARTDLSTLSRHAEAIRQEMSKVIVGQQALAELLLTAILADGHVLLEGVPGVAKTLTAKLLARTLDVPFSRLQFTPDLMPSDVLGTSIFRPNKADFEFRPGPIFASIVLIDEINRAPAKTQSALFEVMEERQVTQDGTRYTVPDPFVVLATQNPIEQEGTYRLPEAQLDRFLFKLNVGYPTVEEEVSILQGHHAGFGGMPLESVRAVLTADTLRTLREQVRRQHVEPKLLEYIARLVGQTRAHKGLYLGASPRASLALLNGAKALAALRGRDFVTPEDVQYLAAPVLRHRIQLTPEREMEGSTADDIVKQILQQIEVPR